MPHHNFCRVEIGKYEDIKKFYDVEITVARLNSGWGNEYYIQREDGYYVIRNRIKTYRTEDTIIMNRIKYHDDGRISINISDPPTMYRENQLLYNVLSFLPENIHIYEHGKKTYLIYDVKDKDVRKMSYDVKELFELTSNRIVLHPDGEVEGAKLIKRGAKTFAEDKPLKDQLNAKHLREMTKARLDGSLSIGFILLNATFRGVNTGLYHPTIEVFNNDATMEGPNSGLIRKLHVGRFVSDPADIERCRKLAVNIIKDIPDSCLFGDFKKIRDRYANKNI